VGTTGRKGVVVNYHGIRLGIGEPWVRIPDPNLQAALEPGLPQKYRKNDTKPRKKHLHDKDATAKKTGRCQKPYHCPKYFSSDTDDFEFGII